MRTLAAAGLLCMTVLAGCFSPDPPPPGDDTVREDHGPGFTYTAVDGKGLPVPVLLCHEELTITAYADEVGGARRWTEFAGTGNMTRCNLEMTPDDGREGNEVTIAVNPLDPRNIVGGAKDYYPADAGECVWDGVYVTHDGGRTPFQDRSFDGSPWRLRQGDVDGFSPNYASQLWCTTDPVAYFNTAGDLYYLLMAYQADPVTGSKAGEEVGEDCEGATAQSACGAWPGAFNDWAFNRAVQIVAVSDDGGDSFHTFTPVLEGTFPVNFHDKGWIAASSDGTIHVMWLAFFVPGNQYCRSTDGGQSYLCTEVAAVQFLESGQGSFIEVGTTEQVYLAWHAGGIRLKKSTDTGATWGEIQEVQDTNGAGMPGLSGRDFRGGFPALATDRNPDSPLADALYFVWQDACAEGAWAQGCRSGGSSVWAISSHDEGATWSQPVRLSSNATHGWSIFPAVSVSPGGVVDVSWMETRGARVIPCPDDPGLGQADCDAEDHPNGTYESFEQFYAYSLDGGKTFSDPINIRDAGDGGWDPALCHHQNGNIFIGDYNDIDSSWQAAHPVWPDSRHGPCDVYTATVQRPMFAEGWDPVKRAAAEQWIVDHPL